MRLTNLKHVAIACAVALGFAMSGSSAWAVCGNTVGANIDAQVPYTINICATVANTFTADVDDADFQNVGVTGWAAESGCLIMAADGTFDETNTACLGSYGAAPTIARIVSEDSAGTPVPGTGAQIQINGAFPDQEVRMWFQTQITTNEIPHTAPTVASPASMWYTELTAETDALGTGDGTTVQDGLWVIDVGDAPEAPASLVALDALAQQDVAAADGATYKGLTDAGTGNLTIDIGVTIQTDGSFTYDPANLAGDLYESGDYEGSFEAVLFY